MSAAWRLDPWLGAWLAACLAWVFWPAAWHKWRDPAGFEAALRAYRVLPTRWLPLGRVLPGLEALAGALLVGGWVVDGLRAPGALIAASLLALYAAAMSINLVRGRVLDCGCGGAPQPLSWGLVVRNGVLAAMAIAAGLPAASRAWQIGDLLMLVPAVLLFAVVFAAMNQVMRQSGARWREAR